MVVTIWISTAILFICWWIPHPSQGQGHAVAFPAQIQCRVIGMIYIYIYLYLYIYIYTNVRQRLKKITLFFHQTWRKHGLLPANFLEANPMDHGSHAAWDLFWYPLLSILRLAGARFAPFSWSGPYFLSLCAVYGWQLLRVLHCGTACRRTKNFGRLAVVEDHGANMCKHQILGEHAGYHVSSAAEGSPRFTSANVKDKSFLPCPVAVGPIFAMRLVG
jgi:hypothetical protein